MRDFSHYHAIRERLARETGRLSTAKTPREAEFRRVQVSQAKKELAAEEQLLGIDPAPSLEMTDEGLLAELRAEGAHEA